MLSPAFSRAFLSWVARAGLADAPHELPALLVGARAGREHVPALLGQATQVEILYLTPQPFFFLAKPSPLGFRPPKSGRSAPNSPIRCGFVGFFGVRTQTARLSAKNPAGNRMSELSKTPDAS